MKNKYTLSLENVESAMSDISKEVQSLLVDASEGKYILEEATVDEGDNRTVIRISAIPTSGRQLINYLIGEGTSDSQTWIDHRLGGML